MSSPTYFGPVQQNWMLEIPLMQQSVVFAAVRAPDGIRKDHPVKVLMRWFRRCVMLSAFDKRALTDPFSPGGGSFTGPFEKHHAEDAYGARISDADWGLVGYRVARLTRCGTCICATSTSCRITFSCTLCMVPRLSEHTTTTNGFAAGGRNST